MCQKQSCKKPFHIVKRITSCTLILHKCYETRWRRGRPHRLFCLLCVSLRRNDDFRASKTSLGGHTTKRRFSLFFQSGSFAETKRSFPKTLRESSPQQSWKMLFTECWKALCGTDHAIQPSLRLIQHACDVAKATAADLQCCAHSAAVLFVIQIRFAGGMQNVQGSILVLKYLYYGRTAAVW